MTILAYLAGRAPIRRPIPQITYLHRDGGANEVISYREALVLGVALSLNNVGSGIGAGVADVPLLPTTVLAGLFSLLCLGVRIIDRAILRSSGPGRSRALISGLILVVLGSAMVSGTL